MKTVLKDVGLLALFIAFLAVVLKAPVVWGWLQ